MRYRRKLKKTKDGRVMLNLGCGANTHWEWNNIDFSPYARLARHRFFTKFVHSIGLLSVSRHEKAIGVDPEIIHWDIRKGIPFNNNSFDVVYHRNFIAHLYKDTAVFVTRECFRVLKPGGRIRVVVPDLFDIVRRYIEAVDVLENGCSKDFSEYERALDDLFELMIRRDRLGTSKQSPKVRLIDRIVWGDVVRTGELQLWHYDKLSMKAMLQSACFQDIILLDSDKSRIKGWEKFALDKEKNGIPHKPKLFFMEATK